MHHFDTPEARKFPQINIANNHLFPGDRGGVVAVLEANPAHDPGRGFHGRARYGLHFKLRLADGRVQYARLTLRFSEVLPDRTQNFEVRETVGPEARMPRAHGEVVATGNTGWTVHGKEGMRVYAGSCFDPFAINGAQLGLIKQAFLSGEALPEEVWDVTDAQNAMADHYVSSIVIELPPDWLPPNLDTLGYWSTTRWIDTSRQVNRCGLPLLTSMFLTPEEAARFNAGHPDDDYTRWGPVIHPRVATVVDRMGTYAGDAYATNLLDELLLPDGDMLTYRPGTPAQFFPHRNGLSLREHGVEAMYHWSTGLAIPVGRGVIATREPSETWPYLVPAASDEPKTGDDTEITAQAPRHHTWTA